MEKEPRDKTVDYNYLNPIDLTKLGTEDDTLMVGDEFWVLSLPELDVWIDLSPHNAIQEVL